MKHVAIVAGLVLLVCLVCFTPINTFAQATSVAIKVEAMSPGRLEEMGQPDPGDNSYISSGLKVVGVGSYVWLSGWDISDGATFAPGSSYNWVMTTQPGGSSAAIDNATGSLVKFQPDVAGQYTVTLTLDGKDTTVTIRAATYIGVNRNDVSTVGQNCKTCHSTYTQYTDWATSGHATMFEQGLDGVLGAHWGASCLPCHTQGYNTDTLAVNGGFDDVASTVGFDLADSSADGYWIPFRAGNYDSLLTTGEAAVTAVAGIGCENCHGPFNTSTDHFSPLTRQPVSMDAALCAQCHNEPWRHNIYSMYENSVHAEAVWSNSFVGSSVITAPDGYDLGACVRCHDGQGFVNFTKGIDFDRTAAGGFGPLAHTTITCQTCHEPHSTAFRVTPTASDTLGNGFAYTSADFGQGMICASCHKYRRGAADYVATSSMSSHWGPHHRGAADTWLGQNGFEYGQTLTRTSAHQLLLKTVTCTQCHMSATADTGTAARDKIGGHSWSMEYTDTTSGISYDNVTGCVDCHGPITSFEDIKSLDFDMDGTVEPFMEEVDGLLEKVATALPPVGSPTIDYSQIDANPADSAKFRAAYWNYLYVEESGDGGAHNPNYTIGLLQLTLNQLTGVEFTSSEIPTQFEMSQNYPNPFNPTTEITFALPKAGPVLLEVYDLMGRVVATLVNQDLPAGSHKVMWNARSSNGQSIASGVYLYRIVAGDYVATKKMVLLK